jgi:hypothetical protein
MRSKSKRPSAHRVKTTHERHVPVLANGVKLAKHKVSHEREHPVIAPPGGGMRRGRRRI